MPASVSDPSSYIEDTLRSSLDRHKLDINQKLVSSSKKVLLHKIDFTPAQGNSSFQLDNLRAKYTPLNPSGSKQKSASDNEQLAGKMSPGDDLTSGNLPSPRCILYPPEKIQLEWTRTKRIGAGLHNMGNTCFLNSTLQCLTYTAPLVNYLLTDDHANKCHVAGFCMVCELQRHVRRCFEHSGSAIKPQVILQKLRMIAKNMQFGRQEDAHEFLRHVIDAMQRACLNGYQKLDRYSKETTVVNQIFGGYLRSQVVCMYCKGQSNTYDPFMDICLDIKNVPTVQRSFEKFVEVENLDLDNAYNCTKCKKKVPAQKRFTIHKAPNILTIQLKRFAGVFGGKINKHIQFSERLNLRPYMSNRQGEPLLYSLYAVLVHSGFSSSSGHYYCYVKGSNQTWHCMNDSSVHPVGSQRVLQAEAYLLFYVRASRKQPTQSMQSPMQKQSVNSSPNPAVQKPNNLSNKHVMERSSLKKPLVISTNNIKSPPPSILKSPSLKSPDSKLSSSPMKSPLGSKLVKTPPSPMVSPTNPLKSAPTVHSIPSSSSSALPNLSQRDKVSFGIKLKSPDAKKTEKPKIVMRITNGKVSYSSVSPSGEKSKPVFPQVPKRLVAYDDDSESEKESAKETEAEPVKVASKPNGDVNKKEKSENTNTNTPMKNLQTFEPVFDCRLNTTTQVPGSYGPLDKSSGKKTDASGGSPFKDPRQLRKSVSLDGVLSVNVSPADGTGQVNSTTHWHILDQDARSPSVASSSGSVNSTTGWKIRDSVECPRRRVLLPEAQHPGWKVTDTPMSRTASALVHDDISPGRKSSPKMALFGKYKSKDDSFVESSTYLNSDISPKMSFKALKKEARKNAAFDDLEDGEIINGVDESNEISNKLNGNLKNGVTEELSASVKKKKKKKKHKETDEENTKTIKNNFNRSDSDSSSCESYKRNGNHTNGFKTSGKAAKRSMVAEPEEESVSLKKSKIYSKKEENDSELEEGEWVEEKTEKKEKNINSVPTQDWDHHVTDGYKSNRAPTNGQAKWDGLKRTNNDVVKQLKQSGSFRGFGNNVSSWDGGVNKVDDSIRQDKIWKHQQDGGWEKEYEQQLDAGREKKQKKKDENRSFGKDYNAFQRQYDDNRQDRRHSWGQPYNSSDRHGYRNNKQWGGGYGNNHNNSRWHGNNNNRSSNNYHNSNNHQRPNHQHHRHNNNNHYRHNNHHRHNSYH